MRPPKVSSLLYKHQFTAASFSCLFLMCQLHIIAKLVHHLHESLIHDLLPGSWRTSFATHSVWHEEMKLPFVRNMSTNRNLSVNHSPMRLYQRGSLHNSLIYPAHNTVGIRMKKLKPKPAA